MSLPTTLDSYDDCTDFFDRALADPFGIRIAFTDSGQAALFCMRMHQCRALHRALHRRLYPDDDPRHGRTEFDRLMVRAPRFDGEEHYWVYIERATSSVAAVETLSQEAPSV
jgi:hypothetical protein